MTLAVAETLSSVYSSQLIKCSHPRLLLQNTTVALTDTLSVDSTNVCGSPVMKPSSQFWRAHSAHSASVPEKHAVEQFCTMHNTCSPKHPMHGVLNSKASNMHCSRQSASSAIQSIPHWKAMPWTYSVFWQMYSRSTVEQLPWAMDPVVESANAKREKMYEYFMDFEFWRFFIAVYYGSHEQ